MSDTLNQLIRGPVPTFNAGGAVQVNPLAAISAGNQAATSEFEARAWQAKQAAGNAFLQSIDPNTGQPNQAQLLRNLAANPATAMAAQPSAQAGQTLDQETYDLHNKRFTGMMSGMGQLIADNPNGVPADAANAFIDARLSSGLITPEMAAQARARVGADPVKNTQQILQGMSSNLSAQTALEAARPATGTLNTGAGVTGTARTPILSSTGQQGAVAPVGAVTPVGMTPSESAAYQQWLLAPVEAPDPANPSQTKHYATRGAYFQERGVDPAQVWPGALQGGGAPGAGAPRPATGTGGGPGPSPNKPAAVFGAGSSVSSPSQADLETQKAGVQSGVDLMKRADQVSANRANFGTMLSDAQKLDSMGPGTDRQTYLNALSQKWLGTGLLGNATPEQIAASESFAKIGNMIAGSQMAALGASDARQQLAIGSNPHSDLSKLGNERIIHMLQGNEDAIEAKAKAWRDWTVSHGAGSYQDFQNNLNKNFDLRVFQQQYMKPDEIADLRKQLESQGKAPKFLQDVARARQQGWIP